MPTYEFQCGEDVIERLFSVNECPSTILEGGKVYKKIISSVSVVIPDHMKAGAFEDNNARQRQFRQNEQAAKAILAGDTVENSEQPREFKADLDNRIAKHTGRTRIG